MGAYAPYSKLSVGAAALDQRRAGWCHRVQTWRTPPTASPCAPNAALVGDLHRTGGGRLVAVAVTDGDGNPAHPLCGRCRQLLYEAGGANLPGERDPYRRRAAAGRLRPRRPAVNAVA